MGKSDCEERGNARGKVRSTREGCFVVEGAIHEGRCDPPRRVRPTTKREARPRSTRRKVRPTKEGTTREAREGRHYPERRGGRHNRWRSVRTMQEGTTQKQRGRHDPNVRLRQCCEEGATDWHASMVSGYRKPLELPVFQRWQRRIRELLTNSTTSITIMSRVTNHRCDLYYPT